MIVYGPVARRLLPVDSLTTDPCREIDELEAVDHG